MIKITIVFLGTLVLEIVGHGMMLGPPGRSSLWRFDSSALINYNDNENFCGGRSVQWDVNGGNCGVCGDNYADPQPRNNENTGLYGQGKIVASYTSGQIIETNVLLTANHVGYFEFSLCEITDENAPESGEDCFKPLKLADGTSNVPVPPKTFKFTNSVQLPEGFTCKHCVLRWHYRSGNSWGFCEDGSSGMGCGPQETFRSCADIEIV